MTNTTIENFPANKLNTARKAFADAYKRTVRAAARAGQVAPSAPEIVVVAEHSTSECDVCNRPGHDLTACTKCNTGIVRTVRTLDLEIRCERQTLAGWEFLAVVEPLEGGNLIRRVPGANVADGTLDSYRSGAISCDHCATKRRRNETFVVRHEDGHMQQVGRSCLADFLGGQTPAALIASLTYESIVRGCGDDEGGSGGSTYDTTMAPLSLLVTVAAIVRVDGFVAKSRATEGSPSTASIAITLMAPPPVDGDGRREWFTLRERYATTPEDTERAAASLEWARELSGASDYEQNLRLVAQQSRIDHSHVGILASAVSGYERATGAAVRRTAVAGTSAHVGVVGKREAFRGTVERIADLDTQYGILHVHTIRDASGNALVWKTTAKRLTVGAAVDGKCTVKAHTEFRGEPQTELSRCSF